MRPRMRLSTRAVGDNLTKVAEIVRHALHKSAVIRHRDITLNEATVLGVEVQGTGFAIAEELELHGNPCVMGSGAAPRDGLRKVVGDRDGDPGLDAVHARPIRIGSGGRVEEDVILEGELPNGEKKLISPADVAAGGEVEDDGDEAPDVLDSNSLRV